MEPVTNHRLSAIIVSYQDWPWYNKKDADVAIDCNILIKNQHVPLLV